LVILSERKFVLPEKNLQHHFFNNPCVAKQFIPIARFTYPRRTKYRILSSGLLCLGQPSLENKTFLEPKWIIQPAELKLIESKSPTEFLIKTEFDEIMLRAEYHEEAQLWIKALQEMKNAQKKNPICYNPKSPQLVQSNWRFRKTQSRWKKLIEVLRESFKVMTVYTTVVK
jgi:hypothetical protein